MFANLRDARLARKAARASMFLSATHGLPFVVPTDVDSDDEQEDFKAAFLLLVCFHT